MKNVRLIATDMDHTLLTEAGELPPGFLEDVAALHDLGVEFAIASGRPLCTLQRIFAHGAESLIFISDNGGAICRQGELVYQSLIPTQEYQAMLRFARASCDGIPVLCGMDEGYIAREHAHHAEFIGNFFSNLTIVDDMSRLSCAANKFTLFFPNRDSKAHFEAVFLPQFGADYSVTVGDDQWIDMMNHGVNKGQAMKWLGAQMGIDTSQMMAFGDTYNDIEMLQAVYHSYLMANAAADMSGYARFRARSNEEFGVSQVLREVIRQKRGNP